MKTKKEITNCINKLRRDMKLKGIYISSLTLKNSSTRKGKKVYTILQDRKSSFTSKEYNTIGAISALKWIRENKK